MKSKLKYGIIQPLTGGVVFAAEQSFGKSAEYILSYPGLEAAKLNKDNDVIGMGNERHFLEYFKNNNTLPPYIQFNHGMFDVPNLLDVTITHNEEYKNKKFKIDSIYKNQLDLIAAVPVCSGLSAANTTDHGKEDCAKNDNLKFLTEYTLKILKPKVYIFENAPQLYSPRGFAVRDILNKLAEENGYSLTYVKTDTKVHHNIQNRSRTFAIFWQWLNNEPMPPPIIGTEYAPETSLINYLKQIPEWASQNEKIVHDDIKTNPEFNFIKHKYGKNWRPHVNMRFKTFIVINGLTEEFLKFAKSERKNREYQYCLDKLKIGKGFMDRYFFYLKDNKSPAVYHGNTWSALHPEEDRRLTMREYMHLMGLPHDFEYLHNWPSFASVVGQNVPVKTFKFWIDECKKVLEDWNKKRIIHPVGKEQPSLLKKINQSNIYFHNNLNPKESHYE